MRTGARGSQARGGRCGGSGPAMKPRCGGRDEGKGGHLASWKLSTGQRFDLANPCGILSGYDEINSGQSALAWGLRDLAATADRCDTIPNETCIGE